MGGVVVSGMEGLGIIFCGGDGAPGEYLIFMCCC